MRLLNIHNFAIAPMDDVAVEIGCRIEPLAGLLLSVFFSLIEDGVVISIEIFQEIELSVSSAKVKEDYELHSFFL